MYLYCYPFWKVIISPILLWIFLLNYVDCEYNCQNFLISWCDLVCVLTFIRGRRVHGCWYGGTGAQLWRAKAGHRCRPWWSEDRLSRFGCRLICIMFKHNLHSQSRHANGHSTECPWIRQAIFRCSVFRNFSQCDWTTNFALLNILHTCRFISYSVFFSGDTCWASCPTGVKVFVWLNVIYAIQGNHWWPTSFLVTPDKRKVASLILSLLITLNWQFSAVVVIRRMNEVAEHWARLVLAWVTVFGRVYHLGM